MEKDNAYFVNLSVETKPLENFEGFWIDKNDESKGRHEGQVGIVKSGRYFYRDGETKSGVQIHRDNEILKFIKNLCNEASCDGWFKKADDKYETIEEFIEGFNNESLITLGVTLKLPSNRAFLIWVKSVGINISLVTALESQVPDALIHKVLSSFHETFPPGPWTRSESDPSSKHIYWICSLVFRDSII